MTNLRPWLEELYAKYNDRGFVTRDPIASIYRYDDSRDREIAGLIAAGLAYGNVLSIIASVENLLARLGPSPRRFIDETPPDKVARRIGAFRHRWTSADEIANFLNAVRTVCEQHGTLGDALRKNISAADDDIQPALALWHGHLVAAGLQRDNSLFSDPAKTSACKRLHLTLRWLIRSDAIDPGGWHGIPPRLLLYPVDVHIHRIARTLKLTRRNAADLRTVREITKGFRRIAPDDPVKYDFALTRLPLHEGIRGTPLAKLIRDALR